MKEIIKVCQVGYLVLIWCVEGVYFNRIFYDFEYL